MPTSRKIERTADGHYVVIDGRKWRATNPNLPESVRQELVNELMKARRDVRAALKKGDTRSETEARARVMQTKIGLGERGPQWWQEDAAKNALRNRENRGDI